MKALSGFYYVAPEDRPHQTVQCRARGIFKKRGISPLVGDRVEYSVAETGEGTVDEIEPRSTELIRPPIANAEQAVLVFSVRRPVINLQLLDKFLAHVESVGLEPLLCFSKRDLLDGGDAEEEAEFYENTFRLYENIGYRVISTSAKRGEGVEEVREALQGKLSVFAGQSGVGKSSLLNALFPGLQLETNEISEKLGRGKHTTRHVELIPLGNGGGFVADTPGFSQLDFMEIEAGELGACFPEFAALAEECRFRGCLHLKEPSCKVREASETGGVAESRYRNYLAFIQEIKERKPRY